VALPAGDANGRARACSGDARDRIHHSVVPNPESRIPSPESRVPSPESRNP
jgi:hypothetical protein